MKRPLTRFYAHRTPRGDHHHRHVGGPAAAGRQHGPRVRPPCPVWEQPEAIVDGLPSTSQTTGLISQRRLGKQLGRACRLRHGPINRAAGSIKCFPLWTAWTPCTTWAKAAAVWCSAPRGSPRSIPGTCTAPRAVPPVLSGIAVSRRSTCGAGTGRTDYAINGGSICIPSGPGPSSIQRRRNYSWPNLDFNGIAAVHSQVTEAMILDSKKTTYLLGEKYMSPENCITWQRSGRPVRHVGRRPAA